MPDTWFEEAKTTPYGQGVEGVRGIDSVQVIRVVEVKSCVGEGTEKDPCRIVTSFWSLEGDLLAVNDRGATSF